jgi:hypothetical protein
MTEPFSYRVPTSSSADRPALDGTGKVSRTGRTPLREGETGDDDAPGGFGRGATQSASDTGKRNLQWNPVGPGLVYLQSVFITSNEPAAGRTGRGRRGATESVRYISWMPPCAPTPGCVERSGRLTGVRTVSMARRCSSPTAACVRARGDPSSASTWVAGT